MHIQVTLLGDDERPPYRIRNPAGTSALFFTCDHAGNEVPRALGTLGISSDERLRHIGWDIGIAGVATRVADALDAFLIASRYSRLAIDCNRAPGWPTSIARESDGTLIPANQDLADAESARRVDE